MSHNVVSPSGLDRKLLMPGVDRVGLIWKCQFSRMKGAWKDQGRTAVKLYRQIQNPKPIFCVGSATTSVKDGQAQHPHPPKQKEENESCSLGQIVMMKGRKILDFRCSVHVE